jgi:ribosomal protein S18 acetylase RimI-like enzyme
VNAAGGPAVTRRPVAEDDLPFLERLYASTREQELELVPWDVEAKRAFVHSQFSAQTAYYAEQFPDASFEAILVDGLAAGRLYVDRREHEIRIVDISLLPEHRGRGIGTRLLEELMAEARERGLALRIHVERNNRAQTLYRRLGFREIGGAEVYLLMEWRAEEVGVGAGPP